MNYCTDQLVQVRYPSGAGGKFLVTCLFLWPEIAHWIPELNTDRSGHMQWYQNAWSSSVAEWVKYEPNQPWGLDFYSRRMHRNNHLSQVEFNLQVQQHASEYFHQCWQQRQYIPDHWHKPSIPEFFKSATWIEILVDSNSLAAYHFFAQHKLWQYDHEHGTIHSSLDNPDLAWDHTRKQHMTQFGQGHIISGYASYQDFFDRHLMQQEYVGGFVNQSPDPNCAVSITLSELLHPDSFIDVIERLEKHFGRTVNHDHAREMQRIWATRSGLSQALDNLKIQSS